jgi:uncharacterized FlgJ-related protein
VDNQKRSLEVSVLTAKAQSEGAPLVAKPINMDLTSNTPDTVRDAQISAAFSSLQDAMTDYVEDLNRRLDAGLAVRRSQTTFEVHELEKADALVSVSLTDKNHIQYSNIVKRNSEVRSGTIDIRLCPDLSPALMFPDFPHPSVQVSYRDASKRLIDSSF